MTKYNVNFEGQTYEGFGLTVALDALPANILIALAQRGLDNKIRDAGAMTKEEKEALGDGAIAHIQAKREAIVTSLLAGEWSQRPTGPRLKGLDALVYEVAEEHLRAAFAAAKKPWPSGKGSAEAIRGLSTKYIEKYGENVRKEAQDRLEKQASRPVIDLDVLN